MMRILVTGGRNYQDKQVVQQALMHMPEDATLVHGAATGADSLAAQLWGEILGRPIEAHPADWTRYGKAGGPIRNQEMLDSGIDLVIAFPGGHGTEHMVRIAREAGVPIQQAGISDGPKVV